MITLITPTGGRPEAFSLCEKYMKRQTYKGLIQWIVVDDMPKYPTICTMNQEYIAGPMEWREGINTQRPNMDAAFHKVKGDSILVIEDDDWYAPNYIEIMTTFLNHWSIVGEGNAKYYNIKTRSYKEMMNFNHSSLCQTGIRKDSYNVLERAIHSGEFFFDIFLWNRAVQSKASIFKFLDLNLCIGMKGLPGKGGIGVGHTAKNFLGDPNFGKLKSWIGAEDAQSYIALAVKS